jgi:hypothetical protein
MRVWLGVEAHLTLSQAYLFPVASPRFELARRPFFSSWSSQLSCSGDYPTTRDESVNGGVTLLWLCLAQAEVIIRRA